MTTPSLFASCPLLGSTPRPSSAGDSLFGPGDRPDLWRAFWRTRDDSQRNLLVAHYLPLARLHARRLSSRAGSARIQLDEIFSAACEGLMQAVASFDPRRGIKFQTYAARRITGAVLDWLREVDAHSRMIRVFERRRQSTWHELSCRHGRAAADEEVASTMGLTLRRYARLVQRRRAAECISIDAEARGGRGASADEPARWELPPKGQPAPSDALERQMMRDFLCRGLSPVERQVLILYYYEDLTMAETGRVLGLSEARVCQIHRQVVHKLAARLSRPAARMAI